ncbi:MAG TPA: sulfonate ABC transporter substrate-binding protein, partial [Telluria sp.]
FYLAARPYAEKQSDVIAIVLDELARVDAWGQSHPREVAALLARQTGLDLPVLELAAGRYSYGVQPVSPAVIAEQQKIADVFTRLKLIPTSIVVKDAQLASRP